MPFLTNQYTWKDGRNPNIEKVNLHLPPQVYVLSISPIIFSLFPLISISLIYIYGNVHLSQVKLRLKQNNKV
jgi:hypothetical protein